MVLHKKVVEVVVVHKPYEAVVHKLVVKIDRLVVQVVQIDRLVVLVVQVDKLVAQRVELGYRSAEVDYNWEARQVALAYSFVAVHKLVVLAVEWSNSVAPAVGKLVVALHSSVVLEKEKETAGKREEREYSSVFVAWKRAQACKLEAPTLANKSAL